MPFTRWNEKDLDQVIRSNGLDIVIERVVKAHNNDCDKSQAYLVFYQHMAANVDNDKLTDADFRQVVRNCLKVLPEVK